MKATASAQTACRSAVASPATTKLSSSAMSSTWLTVRVMLTRSVRSASRTGPGSSASTRARMMESGVRSSCAMSAVKSRCARKPASRRSSAWLTAWTSGTISVGIACSGRRTSVRAGPIAAAVVEASRTGSSARRKIRMSISSSTSRIGKVIQATRGKNEATTSSMMTSRCDEVLADLDPVHALADRRAPR